MFDFATCANCNWKPLSDDERFAVVSIAGKLVGRVIGEDACFQWSVSLVQTGLTQERHSTAGSGKTQLDK